MMRVRSLLAVSVLALAPLLFHVGAAGAAGPPLHITPNPVDAGETVTFSGAGCLPHDGDPTGAKPLVYLSIVGADDQGASPAITPKADGTWSYSIPLPNDLPTIDLGFGAVCDGYSWSFNYEPTNLHINGVATDLAFIFLPAFEDIWGHDPTLLVQKSYEIEGFGFRPGESVVLTVHSTPVQLATYQADEFGTVSGTFQLPADTPSGHHELQMRGVTSAVVAAMAILVDNLSEPIPPSTTGTSTSPVPTTSMSVTRSTSSTTPMISTTETSVGPVLAATGSPAGDLTALGVALTGVGAATLMAARRRSRPRVH